METQKQARLSPLSGSSERPDLYRQMSRIYYWLERVYSGDQIRQCKLSQVAEMRPGQRVLYAGVGGGDDALEAARIGARVVVADSSPAMLGLLQDKCRAAGLEIESHCVDIREFADGDGFDAVAANFFLNVFGPAEMPRVLARLSSLVRPGGKVFIADFAPPDGSRFMRLLQAIHWNLPLYTFCLMTRNTAHPIYDYRETCREIGLNVTAVRYFGAYARGPKWYWSITADKKGE
jgi:ubiquinone/menaquinone biosynthesis C-methylase UbiE